MSAKILHHFQHACRASRALALTTEEAKGTLWLHLHIRVRFLFFWTSSLLFILSLPIGPLCSSNFQLLRLTTMRRMSNSSCIEDHRQTYWAGVRELEGWQRHTHTTHTHTHTHNTRLQSNDPALSPLQKPSPKNSKAGQPFSKSMKAGAVFPTQVFNAWIFVKRSLWWLHAFGQDLEPHAPRSHVCQLPKPKLSWAIQQRPSCLYVRALLLDVYCIFVRVATSGVLGNLSLASSSVFCYFQMSSCKIKEAASKPAGAKPIAAPASSLMAVVDRLSTEGLSHPKKARCSCAVTMRSRENA